MHAQDVSPKWRWFTKTLFRWRTLLVLISPIVLFLVVVFSIYDGLMEFMNEQVYGLWNMKDCGYWHKKKDNK